MSQKQIRVVEPSVAESIASPELQYIETSDKLLEKSMGLIVRQDATFHDKPANILYISSQGLGKTLLVATLRTKLSEVVGYEIPMVSVDCSQDWKEYKMKGTIMGVGDETPFVLGAVTGAITMANKAGAAILNLEEINSLTPGGQKMMNSITDWRQSVYVEMLAKKYYLENGAKLIILATMNPSGYGGVFSLNQDLRSRFSEIRVGYPSAADENLILKTLHPEVATSVVERLITLAAEIREKRTAFSYGLGTRDLSRLLANYETTDNLELVLEIDLANKFDGSERATIVDRINAHFETGMKE
jgi:MoxR-like ATPase